MELVGVNQWLCVVFKCTTPEGTFNSRRALRRGLAPCRCVVLFAGRAVWCFFFVWCVVCGVCYACVCVCTVSDADLHQKAKTTRTKLRQRLNALLKA